MTQFNTKTQNPTQPDLTFGWEAKRPQIGHLEHDETVARLCEELKQLQEINHRLTARLSGFNEEISGAGTIVKRPNLPDELFFKDKDRIVHSVVLHLSSKDEVQSC